MKQNKIAYISDKTQNGDHWTVQQMLQDALEDETIINGEFDKALLIKLDAKNGNYTVGFSQSGMSMSECMALIEVVKTMFLREMGY
jgi:hypothetical protein